MNNIQMMWKEIVIGLIVIYVIRKILDKYMINTYNKLINEYGNIETEIIKNKAVKHMKLCAIFAVGPWNKKIYSVYNGLCVLLATIYFLENDEETFLFYLNNIRNEYEFEMKHFFLALYYRSKNKEEQAEYYYCSYLKCLKKDMDIAIIMQKMFEDVKIKIDCELTNKFKNPAIIILLKQNNIF